MYMYGSKWNRTITCEVVSLVAAGDISNPSTLIQILRLPSRLLAGKIDIFVLHSNQYIFHTIYIHGM
ncbi:hypothetical protein HanPI659440_Chr10g0367561 [Helianthus annuus]|nr:hypothetical protein HanPI659440_Chr10g0367561 [Helianthus annuus]